MGSETATVKGTNVGYDSQSQRNIREVKHLIVETANTVDATNTFTVDLTQYGGTILLGLSGCKHTTDNSIIVSELPTSTVSSSVVTLTVIAGTDDDKRVAELFFI